MTGLRQKTLGATKWATVLNGASQLGHLVLQFLLAGILGPDVFGLAARVLAVGFILDQVSEFGFVAALIQRGDLEPRHIDTAFFLNIIIAVLLSSISILIVIIYANIFGQSQFIELLYYIVFLPVVMALGHVQRALLLRRMDYRLQTVATILGILVNIVVAVGMALAGSGAWSILVGYYANYVVQSAIMWLASDWRPAWRFDRRAVRELVSFSMYIAFSKLMRAMTKGIDVLLVGSFLGDRAAGIYSLAYKVGIVTVNQIGAVVSNVLFAGFSRLQDDVARLTAWYLRSIRLLAVTSVLPIVVAYGAVPVLPAVLGERWLDTIGAARVLSFAVVWQGLGQLLGPLALGSRGRSDLAFLSSAVSLALLPAFLGAGVPFGLYGICSAVAVFNLVASLFEQWLVGRVIAMSLLEYVRGIWRVFVAFAIAVGSVHAVEAVLPGSDGGWVLARAAFVAGVAVLAYSGVLWVLDRRTVKDASETVLAVVRARHVRDDTPA
jgi:O-antigen/teichoic acid export membrane protein